MALIPANTSSIPNPRSPFATVFPILSTLACLLCVPALVAHIRGRNFAASVLMLSIFNSNICNIINPLIWPTEFPEHWWDGVGLCDIEVKLALAISGANVGAVTCIFRQLALILDADRTTPVQSLGQRRRKWIFELGLCVVVPCYPMIAHYFVQTNRYHIYSVRGCTPSLDKSWISILLIFAVPLLLCVIATVYCAVAVHRLIIYRRQFAAILSSSRSSMSRSRSLRLFALSMILILIYLPLGIFTFLKNLSFPRHPYSWKNVHPENWSQTIIMLAGQTGGNFDRWVEIGTGFLVVPFFGLGQEAKTLYRSWWLKLGVDRVARPKTDSPGQIFPVRKHDEPGFDRAERCHSEGRPNSDMSITLHEEDLLQKVSTSDSPTRVSPTVHSWPVTSTSSEPSTRRSADDMKMTTRSRTALPFRIWSDDGQDFPVAISRSIRVKNEFELTEHMAPPQM